METQYPEIPAKRQAISDQSKIGYAEKYNADINRLFNDRTYKESHREKIIEYFQECNKIDQNLFLKNVL